MGYFDDFKGLIEQQPKTGVADIDVEQLNSNFLELVNQLSKLQAENVAANQAIISRLESLEQKKVLTRGQLEQELSEVKKLLTNCNSKLDEEPAGLKVLDNKLNEQNSLMKNISSQLHGQGILFFIWAWVLFFTIASVAQEIFHISGFSGIWSWIKVTTGLKVFMGMFL